MLNLQDRAEKFLLGEKLGLVDADGLWRQLKKSGDISRARAVLSRLRQEGSLLDKQPTGRKAKAELCREEALLTSKDPELPVATRHDRAMEILEQEFDLNDGGMDGDAETLGIAGGILKRRWSDLGQLEDLQRAGAFYERGARGELGDDAYAQINSAFVEDLLAVNGDNPDERRHRAAEIRQRIVNELPQSTSWWNAATRAEALFGLQQYDAAKDVIASCPAKPEPWCLESTARQLATLARLHEERPLLNPACRRFFDTLLPGSAEAVRSVFVGKVGLALSGGGFRASFYHLGVLALLAELDVLRHVDVLSCVSGGSIIGACYWLMLRKRLLQPQPLAQADYLQLVRDLMQHFQAAVSTDIRNQVQPSVARLTYRVLLKGAKGALDPRGTAAALQEHFYRPLMPEKDPLYMHDLSFTPADHNAQLCGEQRFHPTRHNWLRSHKVPALVLNATTVNTGHSWQFTTTWMGESPWAIHEAADSVPRLEWLWYAPEAGWKIPLAQAVAASACVPGVFDPMRLENAYDGIQVQLVDGGVYDNQGTDSLLAMNCNVLIVSDASGQLALQKQDDPGAAGLMSYAKRSMDTLMERVRLANHADLSARLRTHLLRGLMVLHMKAGLDVDPIRHRLSQATYEQCREQLTPSGVRKDFQKAIAELRTDLDAFTPDESLALMACGYQMAAKAFERDLARLTELATCRVNADWPFAGWLAEITSTEITTPARQQRLAELHAGSRVRF